MFSLFKKAKIHMEIADASQTGDTLLFDDIAGNLEAKESVKDIVDFIKNTEKYNHYGATMPKGILLYGPPGTGKTLLAKAIAGEANVPFYATNGSDFVQMYVGVGANRIRQLFKKAKKSKKAVIFIDEIDSIGKKRGSGQSGASDEKDQTLNALLTEMSGFSGSDGIVVIAATNRKELLDEALLRAGRFDRHVEVALPDLNARKKILELYIKDKPTEGIDLDDFARRTVYFSGAMLNNLLNEAAIFAAKREENGKISATDLEKAYYLVMAGSEKKDRSGMREKDKEITAYHEAGHALMTKLLMPENCVSKVTIIPSSKGAGGFCVSTPAYDKLYYTKKDIHHQIMVSLAGRAAEEIAFGKDYVTTGASNDIEKSVALAKDCIIKYGMADKFVVEKNENWIEECQTLLENLYEQAKELLIENKPKLQNIVNGLIEKESLNQEELDIILCK